MKWLCKFKHNWEQVFTCIYIKPTPQVMPNKHTFYAQKPQPEYVRVCKRCLKEEWSKTDQFGNVWFEVPNHWQVER